MTGKAKGKACPDCGTSDVEFEYGDTYYCNECENEFDWKWTDSWGRDTSHNFQRARLKKKKISVNEGRCYFCNRTEKDWGAINNEIISNLKKDQTAIKGGSDSYSKQVKEAVSLFKKTWSKVNSRHKVSTLMSDPKEFLPEEISKYCNSELSGMEESCPDCGSSDLALEEEYDDVRDYICNECDNAFEWYEEEDDRQDPFEEYFGDYRQQEHPDWFTLERLCLGWLHDFHFDMSLGDYGKLNKKTNKDVRVNKIEKKMLKQITETFEDNLGRNQNTGGGEPELLTAGEKNTVDSMLIERLISLQENHSSLRRFTWKPWYESDIRGTEKNQYGDRFSSDRSEILAVDTWICPMCYDRFQMQ